MGTTQHHSPFDVFVSYQSPDRSLAEELVDDLEDAGLKVWVDWKQIAPAESWLHALHRGLAASDAVVVLIGSDRLARWQARETQTALGRSVGTGVRLVAVIPPGVRLRRRREEVFPFLDQNQWVDCDQYRGSFRGALDAIIWGITGSHRGVRRMQFADEYTLRLDEPYRARTMAILRAPARDHVVRLTWSSFGHAIERLVDQVGNYGYRINCDACIGINEAGAAIAASLNGAALGTARFGYVKARWARDSKVRILDESILPSLSPNPVIFLAAFDIKQGNALTSVVEHLRELYDDPAIYYAAIAGLTDAADHQLVDLSDLCAFDKIAALDLADVFLAATTGRPGLEPPLGLR